MHNDEINYRHIAKQWIDTIVNPNIVDIEPDLIGRTEGECTDQESVRSGTALLASASVPFNGAAVGVATVNVFESTNCGDDGGLVVRCTIRNDASAFQPHAVLVADGVDLHIAGDEEAAALLSALRQATAQAQQIRLSRRSLRHVDEVNA